MAYTDRLKTLLLNSIFKALLKEGKGAGNSNIILSGSVDITGLSDEGKTVLEAEGFTLTENAPMGNGNYTVAF